MSRRLPAIRFRHRLRDVPDPTENARVVAVGEGLRGRALILSGSRPPFAAASSSAWTSLS